MKKEWSADKAIDRWDRFAGEYASYCTSQGGPHREVLLNPILLELVWSVEGKSILDAGCGEGYLSRILAKLGASVVAVDYSHKMLEIARDRTKDQSHIEYKHGNIENLSFLYDASFDIVISNMVLGNLPGYELAIAKANRLLAIDGSLIRMKTVMLTMSTVGIIRRNLLMAYRLIRSPSYINLIFSPEAYTEVL